jgi:hypothetical protein
MAELSSYLHYLSLDISLKRPLTGALALQRFLKLLSRLFFKRNKKKKVFLK